MDRSSAILQRLVGLHPRQIDLALDRIERLMIALGSPDRDLPPVIHVTGTNGKGSTTAFMRAMLEAAGKGVHVYSSPHLVRFHERIRIAGPDGGRFIRDDDLADALAEVERANAGEPITQYEITTAAAFLVFARNPADALLLEVGLGGRLDATNIVAAPLATVITPISLDHQRFLGATVEEIAREKAGIFKRRSPAVIAPQPAAALEVLEAEAARRGAPTHIANRDWVAMPERGRLTFQDELGLLDLPPPKLLGRHQYSNAGAAIAALRAAGFDLPPVAIEEGLARVEWPARLQPLRHGALVDHAAPDTEIWLDGAHNPGAATVVAETMADLEERDSKPLVLVVGMLDTKDATGFFAPFANLAAYALTVPIPGADASRDPADLAAEASAAGLPAAPMPDVASALARIADDPDAADGPPRVLITGGLYLAGAVLAANGTIPQ